MTAHAGPFVVFAEEAHEDSADLLFMPEATASDWALVFTHAEVRRIGAGLALVQAGEQDRALYLLTEGTVGVRLPRDEGAFKTIDAPSVLGELAFFDGRPRSATLEAVTDVEAVRIDARGLPAALRGGAGAGARHARGPRADPRPAPADGLRGHRGPARSLSLGPVVAPIGAWLSSPPGSQEEEEPACAGCSWRPWSRPCSDCQAAASAAIPSVFNGALTCTVQASQQRVCSGTVPSFDGVPIDVNVAFPPASGTDTLWPVIGVYHGWGGSKISPTGSDGQRVLSRGYAFFSITDRGWGNSCGAATKNTAACV